MLEKLLGEDYKFYVKVLASFGFSVVGLLAGNLLVNIISYNKKR